MNLVIKKAIDLVGSQSELARLVGTGQPSVSKWLRGSDISARFITKISSATQGRISESEILTSLSPAGRADFISKSDRN